MASPNYTIQNLIKDKIICTRIIVDGIDTSTPMRFGMGFDATFNENGINIGIFSMVKLRKIMKKHVADDYFIPYHAIKKVKLSLARIPIRNITSIQEPDFSLDMMIELDNQEELWLETRAFRVIERIAEILYEHRVEIEDVMDIVHEYSGEYDEVRHLLDRDYDGLKMQFGLVDFRLGEKK